MKKRICAILLAGCLVLGMAESTTVYAAETLTESVEELGEKENGFTYRDLADGTVEITGYTGNATALIIPDKLGGKTVTSIGWAAFEGCSSLSSVTIPSGVTSIGYEAFSDCSSLTSIEVASENPAYSSKDGILYSKDKTQLICCPGGKKGAVTIPSSVTSIEWGAFEGCRSLSSVTIPSGVTSIGGWAFKGCSSLSSVTIPSGVTSIGSLAFNGCSRLKSVTIPSSVTSIGEWAFEGCSSLSSVTIPSSVTSIGNLTFCDCSSLSSVEIPFGITKIENMTFYECSSLSSVEIPSSVAQIGYGAFYDCNSLGNVYYGGSKSQWGKIEIGSENTDLTSATIHYNSSMPEDPAGSEDSDTSPKTKKVSITLNGQTVSGTLKARVNKSYSFKAVVTPSNVSAANKKITWSSSDKKIASVNNKGKVTIKKAGTATIKATTADGKSAKVTLKAVNKAVKVTKVKISGNKTMKVNKKQTLTLKVTPVTADNTKVTWSSSNTKVATVNKNGKVTAKKKGTVTITAKAKDGSKKKGTFKITVKK